MAWLITSVCSVEWQEWGADEIESVEVKGIPEVGTQVFQTLDWERFEDEKEGEDKSGAFDSEFSFTTIFDLQILDFLFLFESVPFDKDDCSTCCGTCCSNCWSGLMALYLWNNCKKVWEIGKRGILPLKYKIVFERLEYCTVLS